LLWKVVRDDLRVLSYALRHPDRPRWLMPATALVALYAIDPFNVAVPFVGIVDDGVLSSAGIAFDGPLSANPVATATPPMMKSTNNVLQSSRHAA